jgi:ArsR family metal-binding transcriptional regulator
MARILVQTDDRRTVLDAGDVNLADINDRESASSLLDRLERAIQTAERRPGAARAGVRRVASIVPVSDYRDVGV